MLFVIAVVYVLKSNQVQCHCPIQDHRLYQSKKEEREREREDEEEVRKKRNNKQQKEKLEKERTNALWPEESGQRGKKTCHLYERPLVANGH